MARGLELELELELVTRSTIHPEEKLGLAFWGPIHNYCIVCLWINFIIMKWTHKSKLNIHSAILVYALLI